MLNRVNSMPIRYVSGDLFANEYKAQALAHGCNCKGAMGAGIAVGFRDRYPAMYEHYRQLCHAKPPQFNPSDVLLWKSEELPWVFNLATQESYGRTGATYEAIERSLQLMKRQAEAEASATIAMPRIGSGYGGLSWKKVRTIIERVFADWSGTLYVYEEYIPDPT
jgi:O-acetyl-ADP-ribose deacetylase (regulator of RNase III)